MEFTARTRIQAWLGTSVRRLSEDERRTGCGWPLLRIVFRSARLRRQWSAFCSRIATLTQALSGDAHFYGKSSAIVLVATTTAAATTTIPAARYTTSRMW